MTTWTLLFVGLLGVAAAAPFQEISSLGRTLRIRPESGTSVVEVIARRRREVGSEEADETVAVQNVQEERASETSREKVPKVTKGKGAKKSRRHKAFFLDLPFVAQQFQSYAKVPAVLDPGYDYESESRNRKRQQQDSNIYYIRLPPTPYSYIPGLGYVSQPPTYSTASLRPQIGHAKPPRRPSPSYQRPTNPFINLPIDFVSNGKPTSVYQWPSSRPIKRPTDSPITNLDDLSPGFVSNGKPTSVYQWHAKLKPAKRPGTAVNTLDNGPYVFNGKPTSLYLLNPDGSKGAHQPIRYTDYQQQSNVYY